MRNTRLSKKLICIVLAAVMLPTACESPAYVKASGGTHNGGTAAVHSAKTGYGRSTAAASGQAVEPTATATGQAVTPSPSPVQTPSSVPQPPQETPVQTPPNVQEKPEKCGKLYFCAMGPKKVRLTWKASKGATGYRVYRKQVGADRFQLRKTVTKNTYLDKGLSMNKSYRYKVVAVNIQQESVTEAAGQLATYKNIRYVSTSHQKYSYTEMSQDIKGLVKKYHGLVRYEVVGKSEDGRNIYDVVLGSKDAKKTLLVIANLHAREYVTSLLSMNQIEYYLENYNKKIGGRKVSKALDNIAIHYIPMANPDGTTISQFGIGRIRNASLRQRLYKMKSGSTSRWKANARGVDLNRNYPADFRIQEHRGSEGYSGPYAASESETQAIISLTNHLQKDTKLQGVINYHAMGSIVFGGGEKGGKLARTTQRMYKLARRITGYADSAGYQSSSRGDGNCRTYTQYVKKIPSITLEVGRISCPGPIREYPSIWRKNRTLVLREAMLFV